MCAHVDMTEQRCEKMSSRGYWLGDDRERGGWNASFTCQWAFQLLWWSVLFVQFYKSTKINLEANKIHLTPVICHLKIINGSQPQLYQSIHNMSGKILCIWLVAASFNSSICHCSYTADPSLSNPLHAFAFSTPSTWHNKLSFPLT